MVVRMLLIILIVVFLITSLITFITMQKLVTREKIETQKPKTQTGGIVKISIVAPEKGEINNEADNK